MNSSRQLLPGSSERASGESRARLEGALGWRIPEGRESSCSAGRLRPRCVSSGCRSWPPWSRKPWAPASSGSRWPPWCCSVPGKGGAGKMGVQRATGDSTCTSFWTSKWREPGSRARCVLPRPGYSPEWLWDWRARLRGTQKDRGRWRPLRALRLCRASGAGEVTRPVVAGTVGFSARFCFSPCELEDAVVWFGGCVCLPVRRRKACFCQRQDFKTRAGFEAWAP